MEDDLDDTVESAAQGETTDENSNPEHELVAIWICRGLERLGVPFRRRTSMRTGSVYVTIYTELGVRDMSIRIADHAQAQDIALEQEMRNYLTVCLGEYPGAHFGLGQWYKAIRIVGERSRYADVRKLAARICAEEEYKCMAQSTALREVLANIRAKRERKRRHKVVGFPPPTYNSSPPKRRRKRPVPRISPTIWDELPKPSSQLEGFSQEVQDAQGKRELDVCPVLNLEPLYESSLGAIATITPARNEKRCKKRRDA